MPYQRQYTREEVQGMIKLFEGNRLFQRTEAGHVIRANAAAHANIHAGASFLDQRTRVNTPRQPRTTGTYWSEDDQIDATLDVINSFEGQIRLRQLDMGERRLSIESNLPAGSSYRVSVAHDNSDRGGAAGHLGRNNLGRRNAGSTRQLSTARRGFVLLLRAPGGLLQVQTSFPIV